MKALVKNRSLKVLVIDEEIPYPPDAGKRIRTWNLLKRLAGRHEVHLLCYGRSSNAGGEALRAAGITLHLVEPPEELAGNALYLRLFANLFSVYPFSVTKHYSRRFQNAFDELLRNADWDLVQCEWTPYARFLESGAKAPTVIATHNVESQIWKRRAEHSPSWIERLFFGLQAQKMVWFERRALRRAARVTAVTAEDAKSMREWGVQNVALVPNGVDTDFYVSAKEVANENEILSVASLDWFPNADALEYFAEEIFPLIREGLPKAVFRIVGRRPPAALKEKLSQIAGIDFVGEVEDVRPYLARAAVVVVPLRIGGGSRLKILEALAAGKAIVSTSIGAEGLELISGEHLYIADAPKDFALRVVELAKSSEAQQKVGASGKNLVTQRYGWDGIASRLETTWFDALQKSEETHGVRAVHREVSEAL